MIHPTAIVDPSATLADDVEISAYVIIGADVEIDSGTWIGPHAVIQGPTRIGKDNQIFQFTSLGEIPQDKKFVRGDKTELVIGDRNVIREFCTFNRGTTQDIGKTVLGDDNWIMAYVHLAHDCIIGNHTIFANNATLAGHVTIEDYVILGGFSLVHQFCRVGQYAFTGMGSSVAKDIPPYVMAMGSPASPRGINREGLKRHGFTVDEISQIKDGYRALYRSGLGFNEALLHLLQSENRTERLDYLVKFCQQSQRGIIR
ncbi:MAG: acyl-ACP--UDP-N-acetylglucosamine O-acyltransferase [Thiotrichaceae bacterium]|nr:acyl-ACP--UDP-N-acetylglucosamine O-acyltransferase [Thiotrichaceae bacterium]